MPVLFDDLKVYIRVLIMNSVFAIMDVKLLYKSYKMITTMLVLSAILFISLNVQQVADCSTTLLNVINITKAVSFSKVDIPMCC